VISGIVLAAGTSSRLGRPKQLLDVGGRPLLQRVVDAVAGAGLDEVVVVLGHEADRIREALELGPGARAITNVDYATGQASSLATGLDALHPRSEAAVIVLGDQPALTSEHVRAAVGAWRDGSAEVARSYFGGVPGHPVVAARSAWTALRAASGDVGARGVFEASAVRVARVDLGPEPLVDVDTWDDYARLRRSSG
jgi:molybdenum cofactor cytidylyltransferase